MEENPVARAKSLAVSLLLAALSAALYFASSLSGWALRLENLYYDAWHRWAGQRFEPRHVVLVMIDDATLARYADTPLSFWTPHFAQAIETLRALETRLIVLDFLFSGSPERWLSRLGVTDLEAARRYDRPFRQALHGGDVFLAGFLVGEGKAVGDFILPTPDVLLALPSQDVAGHVGLANLELDADSVVRHYRRRLPIGEAAAAAGLPRYSLAGLVVRRESGAELDTLLRPITYVGPPGSFPFVSFARLLEPQAAQEASLKALLAGKVAIIGAGYAGMNDVHPTPYSNTVGAGNRLMSGPEIQANIIETELSGRSTRPAHRLLSATIVFLGAGLIALMFLQRGPFGALVIFAAYLAFVAGASYWAFRQAILLEAWQMQASPLLALALAGAGKLRRSERERRKLAQIFARYVSERVMHTLLSSGEMPALGGSRRDISVLFSDIRGFTTLSEQLAPEEVVEVLNAYFERACAVLLAEEATIDKFIGDAVMAEFGAPLDEPDHADRALRAALALQRTAQEFATWMASRFAGRELPPFAIGIGIHTGPAVVGNIGSARRMEYTAVGDTVNTASRLEGMTKTVGCPILISRSTFEALGDKKAYRFGHWHRLAVKGRRQAVEALEVWP
ncbi:MAG: adenylate/guanylate cyclase domain-containing protein [Rhodocyclaceae bacterium]|nr:adenylate/guanylate cyclase domain-containing protein [Rhodocyclaceae bacterium]